MNDLQNKTRKGTCIMRQLFCYVLMVVVLIVTVGCRGGGRSNVDTLFGNFSTGTGSKVTVETSGHETITVNISSVKTEAQPDVLGCLVPKLIKEKPVKEDSESIFPDIPAVIDIQAILNSKE